MRDLAPPLGLAPHESPTMNRTVKHELDQGPTRCASSALGRGWCVSGALLLALGLSACGESSGGGPQGGGDPGTSQPPSGDVGFPAGFNASPAGFFIDPNESGLATQLFIEEIFWGRLVDIYAPGATGVPTLRYRDFVIPEGVDEEPGLYLLGQNPVTGRETLTFALNFDDPLERLQIEDLLINEFPKNVGPILPKGIDTFELPPFPFVPRNAVLSVRFNDCLDHDTVTNFTVQLTAGYPPTEVLETLILPDPNFGGPVLVDDALEFRSTRILIDAAVSQFEANGISPPLEVNTLGMPASITTAAPNIAIRIPSQQVPGVGQFQILRNFQGQSLAQTNNGPVDFTTPTADVVRAMRSGGDNTVTGDEFNGFLRDTIRPRLVGSVGVTVGTPTPDPGSGIDHFLVDLTFSNSGCAQTPAPGDVIELAGLFLQVTDAAPAPTGGLVQGVPVQLIVGEAAAFFGGAALYRSPFEAGVDDANCFVDFSPQPGGFNLTAVQPSSEIIISFSEPMDPASIDPYDSFRIRRTNENVVLRQLVIGQITAGTELRDYSFKPALPLSHASQGTEQYDIEVIGGDSGLTDLAGNPLQDSLPTVTFELDPDAPAGVNNGIVFDFNDVDMDGDENQDVQGQFVILPNRGVIQGRPVSRFSNASDSSNPVPSLMTPNTAVTVTEPLVPLGSRMMQLWRLADIGMSMGQQDPDTRLFESDSSIHNIDIERINWAPRGGPPLLESFPNFAMSLGHSGRLPDETHDPIFLAAFFPGSGFFTSSFDENLLVSPNSELTEVHQASQGYVVNPVQSFGGVGNLEVMPYPLNMGADPNQYQYFTWRDTAIQDVAGIDGQGGVGDDLGLGLTPFQLTVGDPTMPVPSYSGLPMLIESQADATLDPLDVAAIQGPDGINTVGLPLLMDFKCFPSGTTTLGINAFDTSLPYVQGCCVNGKANFRVHSSGGFPSTGAPITVDPALVQVPSGGFNPATTPPGAPTPPGDDTFYSGQLDFVIRVSRAFTRFVDTNVANFTLVEPIVLPLPQDQPEGTSISVDFRLAAGVLNSPLGNNMALNAFPFDSYGDLPDEEQGPLVSDPDSGAVAIPPKIAPQFKNDGVAFASSTGYFWSDDLEALNELLGAQLLQARLTFVSNAATGLVPEADSLAIPYILP